MQITYDSGNPADQWRCQLYAMSTRPNQVIGLLIFPLVMGFMFRSLLGRASVLEFAGFEALLVLAWIAFIGFLFYATIAKRTQSGTRICTTTLTPEGFADVTPDSSKFMPWENVKEVRCHNGDIHLFTASGGSFIPRCAFKSPEEAQAFANAATAAWRGDFSLLVPAAAEPAPFQSPGPQPQAWPPAPREGYATISSPPQTNPAGWDRMRQDALRAKKKQNLALVRTIFVVPMATVAFTSWQHPSDPAHAHSVALFNLGVFVVCVPGLIVTWLVGRRY